MKETLEQRIEPVLPTLTPAERHELDNGAEWHERNGQLGLLAKCGWWTPVEAMRFTFLKKTKDEISQAGIDFANGMNKLAKKDKWLRQCIKEVFKHT